MQTRPAAEQRLHGYTRLHHRSLLSSLFESRFSSSGRPRRVLFLTSLWPVPRGTDALVCAFVTSVCVHLYPTPFARDFLLSSSQYANAFVPRCKRMGKGTEREEREKKEEEEITSSNRSRPGSPAASSLCTRYT